MTLVVLRGGPLDGLKRHVRPGQARARFQHPTGDLFFLYALERGEWRHVEEVREALVRIVHVAPHDSDAYRIAWDAHVSTLDQGGQT